jgi:hypothetical protein
MPLVAAECCVKLLGRQSQPKKEIMQFLYCTTSCNSVCVYYLEGCGLKWKIKKSYNLYLFLIMILK